MAWYRAELTAPVPITEAFAYLESFDHVRHWDPAVTHAARLDSGSGGPGEGSTFEVGRRLLGRSTTLRYELVEHDPPHRILVRGEHRGLVSTETVTLLPVGGGTRVTYDTDLRLRGPWRVLAPALRRSLRTAARAAAGGLRRELNALAVASPPAGRRPPVDPDHPSLGVIEVDRDGVAA